jgi:phage shock protein B
MTREVSDLIIVLVGAVLMFVAMPWLFLHYTTRWRRQEEINQANQELIGELTERARQLDERATTLERIADADGTGRTPERAPPSRSIPDSSA